MDWKDLDLKTDWKIYEITSNAFTPEEDKQFKVAALLGGITYDELLEQPLTATTKMVADTAFLYERPKPEFIKREYNLNGRIYTTFKDLSEMTTAQYIDYTAVVTEKFEEHIIELMSIILIPKGHTYGDGYDREQQMEDLGSLKVTEALGIADFFITQYRRLLRRTLLYSKAKLWIAARKLPKELEEEMKEYQKEARETIDELLTLSGSLSLKRLLD